MPRAYKLAFDISIAPRTNNGIGVYARELLRELSQLPEFLQWDVSAICAPNQDETLYELPDHIKIIRLKDFGGKRIGILRAYQTYLPAMLHRAGFNLYHAPGNSIALQAATPPIWSPRQVRRVITVHDIIPVVYPSVYPSNGWKRALRSKLFGSYISILAKDAEVITSSQSSARDLNQRLGVPFSKIHVIPIGLNQTLLDAPLSQTIPDSLLGHRYLLHVGTGNLNKNIPGLLRVFARVKTLMGDFPLKLSLVGHFPDRNMFSIYAPGFERDIEVFTNLTPSQMSAIYRHAATLIFPSFYEGFGLPCLEAMSLGCPVIASNASSIPEVVGNGGDLFDPQDVNGMSKQVVKILSNQTYADEMIQRGFSRSAKFGWQEIALQTLQVYNRAVSHI